MSGLGRWGNWGGGDHLLRPVVWRVLLVCCKRPKKKIIQERVRRPMTFIKY